MKLRVPFILASGSPRRRKLLAQIGVDFSVVAPDVEEIIPDGVAPDKVVIDLAIEKARTVAANNPAAVTLAADTVVVLDGQILGKPSSPEHAAVMLSALSDKTHKVYTGLALIHPDSGRTRTACACTQVTFAPMNQEEIRMYVSTGSPLDKAGAYGIQDDLGPLFVERIDGDFYNVMGLPLRTLYRLLREEYPDLIDR